MSFEADLKAHLQADGTIAGIVGQRIFPVIRPERETVPAITYTAPPPDQVNHLGGRASSLRNFRLQVDLWAQAHSQVVTLDAAVRARMDTAAATFRAVLIAGSGLEDYESETKLYRRMMEFSCWFNE
jgi:hypothetical protein